MTRFGGIVLAGGASRRMGTDKALLLVEGERLVDRAVRVVGEVAGRVVVASGARRLPGLQVDQVPDAVVDGGPLAGLAAALDHLHGHGCEVAAVVAVDHPWPSAAVLAAAVADLDALGATEAQAAGQPVPGALAPVVDGRVQPLHAAWRCTVAPTLRARLDAGRPAVGEAFAAVGGVRWEGWRGHDASGRFATNVNRPEDLPQSRDWC